MNANIYALVDHGAKVTITGGGVNVAASDTTSVISVAGSLAGSGGASVGVGADVGVYNKTTYAYIDSGVTVTADGDIQVGATSSESLISVAAGIAVGEVSIGVDAGVHIFNVHTHAFIGHDPDANDNTTYYNNTTNYDAGPSPGNVHAKGSVVLSANESSNIIEVVGVLAVGEVGVAAGAGVNVINKDTKAFIGDGASVTCDGTTTGLMA